MDLYFDNIIYSKERAGGISVYWTEIIKRFCLKKTNNVQFIEYENSKENIFRNSIHIRESQIMNMGIFKAWSRLKNVSISSKKPFIFHSSYLRITKHRNGKNVTTIHDFIWEKYALGGRLKTFLFEKQKKKAILNADAIICVSHNTKKDLLKYYPNLQCEKIYVIHNGVSEDYYFLNEEREKRYNMLLKEVKFKFKKFAVYVGSRAIYKRFNIAVESCSINNLPLLIIGGGKLSDLETQFLTKKNCEYQHLEGISNKKLNAIYNSAVCLIYPSEYEGFGIPLAEAMKAKCPIICSDIPVFEEVTGKNAYLCSSKKGFSDSVKLLLTNGENTELLNAALLLSDRFDWDNCYNKHIQVYEKLKQEI